MTPGRFFDTNILLYSISRNPAEAAKRRISEALLDRDDGALSVQVLQEFYVQATRRSRPDALPHATAAALLETWQRFRVQPVTVTIMTAALEITAVTGFSYWDSAIIASAQALGCVELYSEDMSHGREVGGTRIVNPYR